MELSNAEAALLGLLSEEPMHPYQIEQAVTCRDMRFWTDLSMSSIYKLLRKLENQELVTRSNDISHENRLRKVYSISEAGKNALCEKLLQLLTEPEHLRWQIDIGMYNCDLLGKENLLEALETYHRNLGEKIRDYRKLLQFLRNSGCPPHRFAIAVRPVFLLKAEQNWIRTFLKSAKEDFRNEIRNKANDKQ
jgi:DNA-binding PadR family transcriptional regulator